MHEKHRSAVLSDVSHGISRLGSSRIGQDAAVTSAKDRRAVHPEGFGSACGLVGFLHGVGVIIADACEVGEAVEIDSCLDAAGLVEVFALVECRRAACHAGHGSEVAACASAYDSDAVRIDIELIGIGAQVADGCLHVFQRLREYSRRSDAVFDGCDDVAGFSQVHAELDAVILVGIDEAAARDVDDRRKRCLGLGFQDIHLHGDVLIAAGRHLFIDDAGDLLDFRCHDIDFQKMALCLVRHIGR